MVSCNTSGIQKEFEELLKRELLNDMQKEFDRRALQRYVPEPLFVVPYHSHCYDSFAEALKPIVPDESIRKSEDKEYYLMTNIMNSCAKYYEEAITLLEYDKYIKIEDKAYNIHGDEIKNMKALLCKRYTNDIINQKVFFDLYHALQSLDKENRDVL